MKKLSEPLLFDALILGADRHDNDPIAALGTAGCKALTPIAGIPMMHRVLAALSESTLIDQITLIGPSLPALEKDQHIHSLLSMSRISYLSPQPSPAASVGYALDQRPHRPLLVTTADHALLRAEMVNHFLTQSAALECDVTVALTPLEIVLQRFPGNTRTAIELKGGPYCGSNLFAFMTTRGAEVAHYWTGVEQARKNPRQVVARALGPWATVSYLLGWLSLERALSQLSSALRIRIGAVVMPFPEAAVDVDSVSDFALVERTLLEMTARAPLHSS